MKIVMMMMMLLMNLHHPAAHGALDGAAQVPRPPGPRPGKGAARGTAPVRTSQTGVTLVLRVVKTLEPRGAPIEKHIRT